MFFDNILLKIYNFRDELVDSNFQCMQKFIVLFLTLLSCYSFSQQKLNGDASTKKIAVLFVGNSLTYTNNLPALVKKSAEGKGIHINTKMIAHPNYAIEDHWNDGKVQKLITSKKYNYVIIQQGPSSQKNGREMLIEFGKKYSDLCKINGVKLCYFMVWPSLTYFHTFDGVIKNHTEAANINKALLLPVGLKWRTYFDKYNTFDYYGPDGFHPSLKGSLNAADIIVTSLFDLPSNQQP